VLIDEMTLPSGRRRKIDPLVQHWLAEFQSWRTNPNQLLTIRYGDEAGQSLEAPWVREMGSQK
jgi:hypothetical protein